MPRIKPGQERKGYANAGNPETLTGRKKSEIPPEDQTASELETKFAYHYCTDCNFNATKAALAAGYSPKTAYSTGPKLTKLPRVRKIIQAHMDESREDFRSSREAIVQFLLRVIYGDTTDLLEIVEEPGKDGKPPKQIVKFKTDDIRLGSHGQLINSITVGKTGTKIDVYSKAQAVDQLNRMMGHYELDNKQRAAEGPTIYLPENGRGDSMPDDDQG